MKAMKLIKRYWEDAAEIICLLLVLFAILPAFLTGRWLFIVPAGIVGAVLAALIYLWVAALIEKIRNNRLNKR